MRPPITAAATSRTKIPSTVTGTDSLMTCSSRLRLYAFGVEAITDPRLCQNVLRFGRIRFDFLAQLADEDAQVFGLLDVVAAPDAREQRAMREHLAVLPDEMHEQIKFLWRQMHLAPAHRDAVCCEINAKISNC